MKTIEKLIPNNKTSHLNDLLKDPSKVLFFDIETTGLSSRNADIYLIGCAFYTINGWICRQYFAQTPAQEAEIVHEFASFAKTFDFIWNFNGTTFDIPFIQAKCKKYAIPMFDPVQNFDMYRMIRPYKNLLHLSGCRQKQLEEYIGLYREDQFNGGELIDLYRIYSESCDEKLLEVLLLHNFEDIQGMLELSKIISIYRLFSDLDFQVESAYLQKFTDVKGNPKQEFVITLCLSSSLPLPLASHIDDNLFGCIYFTGRDKKAIIKLPVFSGELKYFYKDYKNYSYLPDEDQVIHKSVAVYVDKSRRMPASASNCYTRKTGAFIPFLKGCDSSLPLFYTEYKSKQIFICPDETFLSDNQILYLYACSVLKLF